MYIQSYNSPVSMITHCKMVSWLRAKETGDKRRAIGPPVLHPFVSVNDFTVHCSL